MLCGVEGRMNFQGDRENTEKRSQGESPGIEGTGQWTKMASSPTPRLPRLTAVLTVHTSWPQNPTGLKPIFLMRALHSSVGPQM